MPRPVAGPDPRAAVEARKVAKFFQAFGHPLRLRIIGLIAEERCCQCEMAERLGAHPVNVSRHLAALGKAGLITLKRKGNKIYPQLARSGILGFLDLARLLSDQMGSDGRGKV
jgi:DNA-binding transcriptional ArsR family regulator